MIPGHVLVWIDKCEQNIQRMQKTGIDPEIFRQQYAILAAIVRVTQGKAYFLGTQYVFPKRDGE